MRTYTVSASALIEARASEVYAILSDYRNEHSRILPKKYFRSLEVQKGGVGAGTEFLIEMRVLGQTRLVHQVVSEPEPGRMLAETEVETGVSTTFRIEPGGPFTIITITTELNSRDGLRGWLERWMTSAALRRIYSQELKLLAERCLREVEVPQTPAAWTGQGSVAA